MEALASSEVFLFDDFRLDRRGGGLFQRDHNGGFVLVAVGSRGLDILGVLVAKSGGQSQRKKSSPPSGPAPSSKTATSRFRFRRFAGCSIATEQMGAAFRRCPAAAIASSRRSYP